MSDFTPELGQMSFSNTPWQSARMDDDVEQFLIELGEIIEECGLTRGDPASNSGADFECDTFKMRSYCWCDGDAPGHEEGCPPNFEWRDFKACWYKWVGRGASQNRPMSKDELEVMRAGCLAAVDAAYERKSK